MKRVARSSSSAWFVGSAPECPKLLGVETSGSPKNSAHTRFTSTRAVSGLSRLAIASASSRRPLPSVKGTGSPSD